jgi:hypothetical protein
MSRRERIEVPNLASLENPDRLEFGKTHNVWNMHQVPLSI